LVDHGANAAELPFASTAESQQAKMQAARRCHGHGGGHSKENQEYAERMKQRPNYVDLVAISPGGRPSPTASLAAWGKKNAIPHVSDFWYLTCRKSRGVLISSSLLDRKLPMFWD
jgi:hypothetical protein